MDIILCARELLCRCWLFLVLLLCSPYEDRAINAPTSSTLADTAFCWPGPPSHGHWESVLTATMRLDFNLGLIKISITADNLEDWIS